LYPGAQLSSTFDDKTLDINLSNLKNCSWIECKHRWPGGTKQPINPQDKSGNWIKFLDSECIVKNAPGASCDWFFCRKSGDTKCYFFGQGKLTNTGDTYSLEDVIREWKKIDQSIKDYEKKHSNGKKIYFNNYVFYICFVTNKNSKEDIKSEELPQNTILLDLKHGEDYWSNFAYILPKLPITTEEITEEKN